MPELPEVETVRNTLKKLIIGKTIQDVDVFYDKMIRNVDVEEFQRTLLNQTINDIRRYGKYLIFDIGNIAMMSHLRMEGKYFIKDLDVVRDKHEHVIFYFTDGTTLRYHDVRKFGTFDLFKPETLLTQEPLSLMGPEPMDSSFTTTYLKKKLQNKSIAIKTALLDQHIVSGLGNIYVNEVLFLSKIHPERPSNKLSNKELKRVVENSDFVLKKAISLGGTTIRSYTSSLGVTGRFQNELFVHGKEGELCQLCETEIQKIKVNGRGTYFCPSCQKK